MDDADARRGPTTPVKSAARTVELLEFFARHEGLHSLGDVHARLGYPKSSLHVLLRTLVDLGWLETDLTGTLYRIGMRALLVGTSYIDSDEVVQFSRDALDEVAEATEETVHLGRLVGTDVVYLATRSSPHYLRPFSRVGRRLPAHATALGKALLAERPDEAVRAMLPQTLDALTPGTLTTPDALLTDLARTRRRGWALDREENTVGLRCVAVALRLRTPARDAISCSVPVARMSAAREKEVAALLLQARDRIEDTGRRWARSV